MYLCLIHSAIFWYGFIEESMRWNHIWFDLSPIHRTNQKYPMYYVLVPPNLHMSHDLRLYFIGLNKNKYNSNQILSQILWHVFWAYISPMDFHRVDSSITSQKCMFKSENCTSVYMYVKIHNPLWFTTQVVQNKYCKACLFREWLANLYDYLN